MTKIVVVAGGELGLREETADVFVGVDCGSLFLLERGLPLDLAVGDFDSVEKAEREAIFQAARDYLHLPSEKDDTDLEAAVKAVFGRYPEAEVVIYGAFGGRMDHLLTNVFLPSDRDIFPYLGQLTLRDEANRVTYLPTGQQRVAPQEGMTYVSFLPVDGRLLSIQNAKYELEAGHHFVKKCYTSNEFLQGEIEVTVDAAYLVVIHSRDRRTNGHT